MAGFETAYARLLGAKRCVATASGTTALITSLHVMGVDAGDEVIVLEQASTEHTTVVR